MKLAAIATALVASLSLFAGCAADNDGEGGGALYGVRPSKPAADDPRNPYLTVNPDIEGIIGEDPTASPSIGLDQRHDGQALVVETIKAPVPINGVCEACDIDVLHDNGRPGELTVIDHSGQFLCKIWLGKDEQVLATDCF